MVFSGGVPKRGSTYFTIHNIAPAYSIYFQVTRKDVIPFVSFQSGIAKGQTATATVTLYPSPSPVPVTLNLATTSGTGSAVFASTNSTTTTVTQSGTVQIRGVDASSTENNIELSASVSGDKRSRANFSVIWVTLSVRASSGSTVSEGNAARDFYRNATGTYNLGAIVIPPPLTNAGCGVGSEVVGTVSPLDYTGEVFLLRWVMHERTYDGVNQIQSFEAASLTDQNAFDTTLQEFLDTDPQDAAPLRTVYALDAPGPSPPTTVGLPRRGRQTFRVFAVLDSIGNRVPASDPIQWFARSSCLLNADGTLSLATDVAGDNQGGQGCTPVTADLSGSCPSDPSQ